MQNHKSKGLRPGPGDNRPPGNKMTFWPRVVIAALLALITVVLMNRVI